MKETVSTEVQTNQPSVTKTEINEREVSTDGTKVYHDGDGRKRSQSAKSYDNSPTPADMNNTNFKPKKIDITT
jgi:hypothetical protein